MSFTKKKAPKKSTVAGEREKLDLTKDWKTGYEIIETGDPTNRIDCVLVKAEEGKLYVFTEDDMCAVDSDLDSHRIYYFDEYGDMNDDFSLRVKKPISYRPYIFEDFEEDKNLIGKVVTPKDEFQGYYVITSAVVPAQELPLSIGLGNIYVSAGTLLSEYIFTNGKPCGVIVNE
jgi:hypothetical protein